MEISTTAILGPGRTVTVTSHQHRWLRYEQVLDLDDGTVTMTRYYCLGCMDILEAPA